MKKFFTFFAAALLSVSMFGAKAEVSQITCDSARTAALAGKTDSAYVIGYVTSIATAYNSQYNNVSFWMADAAGGGNVIQAYRAACATAEDVPGIGDKVAVLGKLAKYGSTPEFAQGCTFEIIEHSTTVPQNLGAKTIAEFLQLKSFVDTCILTGVIDSVVNTQYGNFNLIDETGKVYIYGLLTAAGENKKCFEEEELAAGDTLTVMAIYNEFNNKPQVTNAIFVSKAKYVEPLDKTVLYVNFPTLNRPENIQVAGTFEAETWGMRVHNELGWYTSNEDLYTRASDQFKFRSADNNDLILCKKVGDDNWVQAIFSFGDFEVTNWKNEMVRLIMELDLSDAAQYAWMENMPTAVENVTVAEKVVKVVRNGQVLIIRGDKTFNALGAEVK